MGLSERREKELRDYGTREGKSDRNLNSFFVGLSGGSTWRERDTEEEKAVQHDAYLRARKGK